jgi:uncharacterized membrane protein
MLYAADFRQKAREALSGRWAVAVGTSFVASLLGGISTSLPNGSGSRWEEKLNGDQFALFLPIILAILSFALIYFLITLILGGAVELGYCRFNRNLMDNNNPQFTDLFSRFNLFGKALLLRILRGIYIFLWTLLLIIPGIIATYSYSMAFYILEENPDMGVNEAINASKEMMRGNKWRLFCLQISFIGWAILSVSYII